MAGGQRDWATCHWGRTATEGVGVSGWGALEPVVDRAPAARTPLHCVYPPHPLCDDPLLPPPPRATAPSPGRPTPGVVKQDKSSRGSVDTTKTRSDPQRVRMSSGERPIGAAKGKQSDTEALCQPPPPPSGERLPSAGAPGEGAAPATYPQRTRQRWKSAAALVPLGTGSGGA